MAVLKVALPRSSSDAVLRDGGRSSSQRGFAADFDERDPEQDLVRPLTREEAVALRRAQSFVSPWAVVLAQVAVGLLAALAAWWLTADLSVVCSALWGAAVVAVPGALMARGATSRVSSASPLASAVAMLGWGGAKTVAGVAMLAMASKVVPGLHWPALLATLVACMQTYWCALLWRGRAK